MKSTDKIPGSYVVSDQQWNFCDKKAYKGNIADYFRNISR